MEEKAIKVYEKLTMIKLKDGRCLFTPATLEQVGQMLNSKEFLEVDGVGFNKFQVETYDIYRPDSIEQFIFSLDKDLQEKVNTRTKEMYERTGRKRESVDHVKKYLYPELYQNA